ncbi:PilZ domain-containing protein [Bdellovibrio sp. HCB2-146]|uniref:PilZ domain-containing protein n=1 Tax=Bdellovibrio sp. HCB2-146 TaxID=3394362 RepID=UPI0039BCF5F3
MKTQIFVTGLTEKPKTLKSLSNMDVKMIQNPYELRAELINNESEKIILAYLPFLELRHFELYRYFQKTYSRVKTFFIVQELSSSMKLKVKASNEFVVLWKTEESHLPTILTKYLAGQTPLLRQDQREENQVRGLVSPSLLPAGTTNKGFQPILPGSFENVSPNGSCVKIKAPFYKDKDFIQLSYQRKDGEFVSVEGQVRWSQWDAAEETQKLGLRFVTSASG